MDIFLTQKKASLLDINGDQLLKLKGLKHLRYLQLGGNPSVTAEVKERLKSSIPELNIY